MTLVSVLLMFAHGKFINCFFYHQFIRPRCTAVCHVCHVDSADDGDDGDHVGSGVLDEASEDVTDDMGGRGGIDGPESSEN